MGAYKTEPVLKDYLWGGHKLEKMFGRDNGGKKVSESWEISVHKDAKAPAAAKNFQVSSPAPKILSTNGIRLFPFSSNI